jgi:hypothetical protein
MSSHQIKVFPYGLQDSPDEVDVVEASQDDEEQVEGVSHV